ncbi:MAG: carboxymuconolactone decarboxylase family protein [Neisseria sp.]|uniref:carboxymuconolactone decarboxylase family protein n=1 Tax=Neisseria sp. TaxID=192066 RepID=UPI0026DA78B8|nr:carboxymuconolactone decarboxylase family protein [Neisseria sp.]MDO4642165.1 carboxymuconolactone decarboxylase family protein [Neisseria sp.]
MKRLDYPVTGAKIFNEMLKVEGALSDLSIDVLMKEIIKIRASQLNGCTFCLDMHVKTARQHGERELRLHHIAVWRESKLFSEKERMALELTETLTRLAPEGLSDELYQRAQAVLSDQELCDIVFSIAQINAWNRLGVAFHAEAGAMDKVMGLDKIAL